MRAGQLLRVCIRSHLREHGGLPHSPETCQVYLRTVEQIDEHHVANVADDRMEGSGRVMTATSNFQMNEVLKQMKTSGKQKAENF